MFKTKRFGLACAVVLALAALIVFGGAMPVLGQGTGTLIADLGFRPDANGFPFENYGNEPGYVNLTPAELQRLFGDVACATTTGGKCVLAPEVKQLMEQWNDQMKGGHCYGFSVAALRFYTKELNPADFGVPNVAGLQVAGNEKLQREIAFHFVFQTLKPVNENVIQGVPSQVLDKLIELLKPGPSAVDMYTIAIFKADGTGGHAVTPFAVEDRGNGQFAILVWDNNFPKVTKEILVDRNANTWSYYAAINPSVPLAEYTGDANTKSLSLYPTKPGLSVRQATLPCPVCLAQENNRVPGLAAPVLQYNEIFLDGNPQSHPHLLITDEQGHRYGYLSDGKFVTEIPGVTIQRVMLGGETWAGAPEPVYLVPVGMKFTLTIDGSLLKAPDVTDVVMIGPGYDIGIEGIQMKPGEKDTLTLSPDGSQLVYKTAGSESPTIHRRH